MMQNIHLIFKTHLDVGFTDYASVVVNNYFKKYIPESLKLARQMRESGKQEQFIWTTGSWLIYEYLEQASPSERTEMERSIELGEIAWHALPFTTHTELMDPELYRFGIGLSQLLDKRFGKKTIAAKLTDVPGHTRGIVPLLAESGVTFLHIGVNPGSTVPKVPRLFRWKDESGAELIVMYESGYGNAFVIEGLDDSLAFGHTIDNMGPQTADQVLDVYREKQKMFPSAHIFASTLNAFASKLEKVRNTLPILDAEIGDTWIHGTGSDPIKVSRYRELLRLRLEWLATKKISYHEPHFFNFNRKLLLVPEHTWGMDEKTFLGDHENYTNEEFRANRGKPNFKKFESSWVEKRAYVQNAVNELEDTPLVVSARERLESIRPQMPDTTGWLKAAGDKLSVNTNHFSVEFNQTTGSISSFVEKLSMKEWAGTANPLGQVRYQTFSVDDYERFFKQYILPSEQENGWSREDFTKPGLETAAPAGQFWFPQATLYKVDHTSGGTEVQFHLSFEKECFTRYGAPKDLFLKYKFEQGSNRFTIECQWFNKQACRLPEATWISFIPAVTRAANWEIEKLGRLISPNDVVENGNRHLHAVGQYIKLTDSGKTLKISPLDSPLVAPGKTSLLDFNNDQPAVKDGMHFCLHNNLWGTNFPMWFEEDCLFRFEVEIG